MNAISDQSNVIIDIPRPLVYPNIWLTFYDDKQMVSRAQTMQGETILTTLFGAIHVTQENWESAVKMYPGKKYQTNAQVNA